MTNLREAVRGKTHADEVPSTQSSAAAAALMSAASLPASSSFLSERLFRSRTIAVARRDLSGRFVTDAPAGYRVVLPVGDGAVEDLSVELTDLLLTIRGVTRAGVVWTESFEIPMGFDPSAVRAEVIGKVLRVTFPKAAAC